jgi:hypothetical protein
VVAVEIHQERTSSSDVSFDFELTGTIVAERPRIQQASFDGQFVLAWGGADFLLEEADEVTGPWAAISGSSPLIITPREERKFYRLRK